MLPVHKAKEAICKALNMKSTLLFFAILILACKAHALGAEPDSSAQVAPAASAKTTNATGRLEIPRSYYSEKLVIHDEFLSAPRRKRPDLLTSKTFDYSGAAIHIIRMPKQSIAQMIKHPLQLINPFAPTGYASGESAHNAWKDWDPLVGSRPLPWAFQDPLTHEPQGVLISVGR
jgi:hypothetical protein